MSLSGKTVFSITLLLTSLLSSCATPVTLQAVGGSKSDGTIDLSFSFGTFEEPVVDYDTGLKTAKGRCKAWGYKNAEAFEGLNDNPRSPEFEYLLLLYNQCFYHLFGGQETLLS